MQGILAGPPVLRRALRDRSLERRGPRLAKLDPHRPRSVGTQPNAVTLRNPDFQLLARAYGLRAEKPHSLRALEGAIRAALSATGPTLIEMTPRMVQG